MDIAIAIMVSMFVGSLIGYLTGCLIWSPIADGLQIKIDDLESEIAELKEKHMLDEKV